MDDKGQELEMKDTDFHFDDFQEDDPWTTNNRELNAILIEITFCDGCGRET